MLKHKQNGTVRFLMRQEKTEKIVGNHALISTPPYCAITPLAQSAKFRCWTRSLLSAGCRLLRAPEAQPVFSAQEMADDWVKWWRPPSRPEGRDDAWRNQARLAGMAPAPTRVWVPPTFA